MTQPDDPNAVDMNETIQSNLNQSVDTDATVPAGMPPTTGAELMTMFPDSQNMQDMQTLGMPTAAAPQLNDSDTGATQMSAQQHAQGTAGDNCSGQVWGDFELGKKIGQGGMGAVYLGRQISLDRPVAIKVLPQHLSQDEGFRKRFQLEAKAVAKITSPYIIQVYGAGEYAGYHYFAMEFIQGKDLGEHLKDGLRPTYEESAKFMEQAVKGLVTAGEHNLVHRDIKPGNMMLTSKGELKIMDFGLVKLKDADGGSAGGLTMAGAVMGTVNYFSPEQGRGEECDQTTDIYAIGVVFYQLLAGTLPFNGTDATSIIYQHIHAEPRPLKEINPMVPEEYQAVVSKCLQKDRRKRYQTADELLKDLELILKGDRPQNAPMDAASTGGSSAAEARGSSTGIVLALAAVVLGGVGYYMWEQSKKEPVLMYTPSTLPQHGDGKKFTPQQQQTPVVTPQGPMAVDALAKAGEMLGTGDFKNADILIQYALEKKPGNEDWLNLAARLNELRAAGLIKEARSSLQAGSASTAVTALDRAEKLIGTNDEIEALRREVSASNGMESRLAIAKGLLTKGLPEQAIAELDLFTGAVSSGVRKLRSIAHTMKIDLRTAHETLANGDIDTARNLFQNSLNSYTNEAAEKGLKALAPALKLLEALKNNQLDVAREHVLAMRKIIPTSPAIEVMEAQIVIISIIVQGQTDARTGDMQQAHTSLSEIEKLIPDSAKEKELRTYIHEYELLHSFRAAIQLSDLSLAQQRLDALKQAAPDSDAHVAAQREYKESAIEENDRLQKKQVFEDEVARQVEAIQTVLAANDPDFTEVSAKVAALKTFAGSERSELSAVHTLIVDKQAHVNVLRTLAAIDAAVVAGQKDALPQYIMDTTFLAMVQGFVGKKQLVFQHTAAAFSVHKGQANIDVVLSNAYLNSPQSDIKITYTLRQVDAVWSIQSYVFKQ